MFLSEIFYSIQGESTYSGLPCVFVRLSGCNLNCPYCDTAYARDYSLIMNSEQILATINSFPHTGLVEITGGEPLLQKEVYTLMKVLKKNNFCILLETNGSLDLKAVPKYVIKIVDIKTPSAGTTSFISSNLQYINPKRDNIKFVISDINDYEWMKSFLTEFKLRGKHILVSTTFQEIKPQNIVEMIIKDGLDVRFQLQMHKYIWDPAKRGV